jgi:phosphotransferase system enzyme I (PtsP)
MVMGDEALAGIRIHVHTSDGLDGIRRLIEISTRDQDLEERLEAMCIQVAGITEVDVVSAYVRERGVEGDVLVMRGNVGFPSGALHHAQLRLGEGITGFVAECLRPVSAAVAAADSRFKPIPELGEDRFPAFLGVPIMSGGEAVGVLVLQRSTPGTFSTDQVTLATALAAPFAAAVEDARRREANRPRGRAVRLRGTPLVDGAAMGRVAVMPTLSALDGEAPRLEGSLAASGGLESLERDLERARKSLRGAANDEVGRALANLQMVLRDARFRERLTQETDERGLHAGLTRVARDYARVPYVIGSRAGDLCVLVYARARSHRFLEQGSILATSRLGAFAALCAVSRRVVGIVSEGTVSAQSPGVAIARAAGIPVVGDATGLFAWVRHGDLLVLDARGGDVDINPSATIVARFRSDRSDSEGAQGGE